MKKLLVAVGVVLVVGCGDNGGATCGGEVDDVSDIEGGSVVVTGDFPDGVPRLHLDMGGQHFTIGCHKSDASHADCDVHAVSTGTWDISFELVCADGTKAVATAGPGFPDTLDVP